MEVVKSARDEMQKLSRRVDAELRSYQKRNVTFYVVAHTKTVATVNLIVTGKRGTGQVDLVIVYDELDEAWTVHSQGKIYYLNSFGDIKMVAKGIITRLQSALMKV